jgi:hypothetical protein
MIAMLFPVAVLVALAGIASYSRPDLPRIAGTVALITTLAALGVAILR